MSIKPTHDNEEAAAVIRCGTPARVSPCPLCEARRERDEALARAERAEAQSDANHELGLVEFAKAAFMVLDLRAERDRYREALREIAEHHSHQVAVWDDAGDKDNGDYHAERARFAREAMEESK